MPKPNLSPEILTAALQGLEAQRARLESQIAVVKRTLGARAQQPTDPKPKRKMSAAARKRIAEAQRKRWAEYHQKKTEATRNAKGPAAATKTVPLVDPELVRRRNPMTYWNRQLAFPTVALARVCCAILQG